MEDDLTQELATILGVRPDMIARDVAFAEQGISAADVRQVALRTGRKTPELIWGGMTIAGLAECFTNPDTREPDTGNLFAEMGFVPGLPDAMYYE